MIPFLIVAGIAGIVKVAGKSVVDDMQHETQNIIDQARNIFDEAKTGFENQKEATEYALEELGNKKIDLVTGILPRFVALFDKFNNIEFENNVAIDGTDDLQLSNFNRLDFDGLVKLVDEGKLAYTNLTAGAITAVALGGISTAAFRTTFAAGLGGMSLLSGIAVPVAFVGYIADYFKADERLEEAKTKLAEAKTEAEKMKTSEELLCTIEKWCEMFSRLLDNLEPLLENGVECIEKIIADRSEECRKNGKLAASNEERKILAATFAFAKAIKTVIQVPILNDDGNVSHRSKKVCGEISNELPKLKNNFNEARMLIDVGADMSATDEYGETALMEMASNNALDEVRELIDSGADVNSMDEYGETALMRAATNNEVDVMRALIDSGAKYRSEKLRWS